MNIESESKKLQALFHGIDTKYIVPPYQRDYAWKDEHIDELWADLISAWKSDSPHFMGAVLLNSEKDASKSSHEIVDGQQRLATFTILFSTIRDICTLFISEPNNNAFEKIDSKGNKNKEKAENAKRKSSELVSYFDGDHNYFIQLNEKDHPVFFEKILKEGKPLLTKDERGTFKKENRIIKAKKVVSGYICDEFLELANAFDELDQFLKFCMTKLIFLQIKVKTDSDAYLLFETLNDRGAELSVADLIKNRLFLACAENESLKKRIIKKWENIVDHLLPTSRYGIQDFLRFYWIAFHANTTKKEIYDKIKRYITDNPSKVEELVDSWTKSAEYFSKITSKNLIYPYGKTGYKLLSSDQFYAEINTLGYSVCYPVLLAAFKGNPDYLTKLLPVIVSFLFKVITICNYKAGRAEQVFQKVLKMIKDSSPLNEIIDCFKSNDVSDAEVQLKTKEDTFEKNDIPKYLLSKIHEHLAGSGIRLSNDVQVEHVFPIKHDKWASFNRHGRSYDQIIYSIGNMTLLESSINQSVQNDIFKNKVQFYKKTRKAGRKSIPGSAIELTYEIYNEYKSSKRSWSIEWIDERTQRFAELACQIWKITVPATAPASTARRATKMSRTKSSTKI
jgi:uncharacterized protein with ParB-like and HNH nuclease domain